MAGAGNCKGLTSLTTRRIGFLIYNKMTFKVYDKNSQVELQIRTKDISTPEKLIIEIFTVEHDQVKYFEMDKYDFILIANYIKGIA